MKTAAVIAEYNPFHNGHSRHLKEARALTGADFVMAVMSGDFVQRGAPAVFHKYMRTRMALLSGADLVLEMPRGFCLLRRLHGRQDRSGGFSLLWQRIRGP